MKLIIKKIISLLFKFLVIFILTSFLSVVIFRFLPVPYTALMGIRFVENTLHPKKTNVEIHKKWVSINEINPNLVLAVIASEDQLFLQHHGFDMVSIEKALDFNEKNRKGKIKGASTISQQTAKNVFLWPGRSWLRKGLEVYFTVLIEFIWSKERIMEVYLNVIEMGDGIYGAEAASQYYFHKKAKHLSRQQSATIAAILPNPRIWNPKKPTSYLKRRINWIERQMKNIGTLNIMKNK